MKTLKNHVLIYDDECPMCDLYTRGFINRKMLDAEGRIPYNQIDNKIASYIDQKRACDEIALVNTQNGQVYYGINSLLTVIGTSFPLFRPLFRSGAFLLLIRKLYAFISYNRKVIAPARHFDNKNGCTPSFHLKYRWAYIIFSWIITSVILSVYTKTMVPFVPAGNFFREFVICGGQIVFQAGYIMVLRRDRILHYLGNMMTISLGGAILLLAYILFNSVTNIHTPVAAISWFVLVVGGMLFEHIRRVKLLNIHWSASLSWVMYRLIILFILYFLSI